MHPAFPDVATVRAAWKSQEQKVRLFVLTLGEGIYTARSSTAPSMARKWSQSSLTCCSTW